MKKRKRKADSSYLRLYQKPLKIKLSILKNQVGAFLVTLIQVIRNRVLDLELGFLEDSHHLEVCSETKLIRLQHLDYSEELELESHFLETTAFLVLKMEKKRHPCSEILLANHYLTIIANLFSVTKAQIFSAKKILSRNQTMKKR